jgi:hypothetical protein
LVLRDKESLSVSFVVFVRRFTKNIQLIYISQESEKALAAMADARAENPEDLLLLRSEADIYLKDEAYG